MMTREDMRCALSLGSLRKDLTDQSRLTPLAEQGIRRIILWTPERESRTATGMLNEKALEPCDYRFSYGNSDLTDEVGVAILRQALSLLRDTLWIPSLLFRLIELGTCMICLPDLSRVKPNGDHHGSKAAGDLNLAPCPTFQNMVAVDAANVRWVVRRIDDTPNIIQIA